LVNGWVYDGVRFWYVHLHNDKVVVDYLIRDVTDWRVFLTKEYHITDAERDKLLKLIAKNKTGAKRNYYTHKHLLPIFSHK